MQSALQGCFYLEHLTLDTVPVDPQNCIPALEMQPFQYLRRVVLDTDRRVFWPFVQRLASLPRLEAVELSYRLAAPELDSPREPHGHAQILASTTFPFLRYVVGEGWMVQEWVHWAQLLRRSPLRAVELRMCQRSEDTFLGISAALAPLKSLTSLHIQYYRTGFPRPFPAEAFRMLSALNDLREFHVQSCNLSKVDARSATE